MSKRKTTSSFRTPVFVVAISFAALVGVAYLANNITGSSAATLSVGRSTDGPSFSDWRDWDSENWEDFWEEWRVWADENLPPTWQFYASPFIECEDEYQAAYYKTWNDPLAKKMRLELSVLKKEIQKIRDYINQHPELLEWQKKIEYEKIAKLLEIYRAKQKALDDYTTSFFDDYNKCLEVERAKAAKARQKWQEWWNRLPWYQKILPIRPNPPELPSSTTTPSTRTTR